LALEREGELLAELKWLRHNQASLDSRLQRVENSLIFRVLRTIGTYYQSNFRSDGSGSAELYREWTQRHLQTGPTPDSGWSFQPLICIHGEEPELAFLKAQTYARWTLEPAGADYTAELPSGVRLEPDALARAVAAMQNEQPFTVYFDHQIVDDSEDALRPVFKPDWSPILAESCDFAGPFVLRSTIPRDGFLHVPHIGYSTPDLLRFRESAPTLTRQPLVSILICTRNSELLSRCLTSLRGSTNYQPIEILVIHHVGTEHDRRITEVCHEKGAKRIPFAGSFNFAAMNNLGARDATGEILLFLNDDVEPVDARWLDRLAARLERPETGAVGAKLVYYNNSIQHAGMVTWEMGGAGHPGRFLTGSEYWPWLNCSREVTAVTGACMAVRKAVFQSVGGFDPAFPVNFNDVDFCLRLAERGLSTIYEAGAVLQHDESQTRAAGVSFDERRQFFLRWHERLEQTDPFYSPHLSQNDESLGLRD
jgi:GT2 family glycosyltransferase